MHKNPTEAYPKYNLSETAPAFHHPTTQHGAPHPHPQSRSALLALPAESLTHITSFLDPVSLLLLGQTNHRLYRHVKDDNTWQDAFVFQFLGIIPEDAFRSQRSLMLRRTESTWRKEFILRWKLRRRWQRSRNATITHMPHHSRVSSVLLMSENALLSTSLLYGVVARSFPFQGKVLKGFLDASGIQHGAGVGNPNVEFTPNVSACALASEGGVAKVLWGYRNGEVAISIAPGVMVATRPTAKFTKCSFADQHAAEVKEVIWATGGAFCVSGDLEGVVKLWETETMKCLWSSKKKPGVLIPVACSKVAIDVTHGILAAGMMDGEIIVWPELGAILTGQTSVSEVSEISEIRIAPPKAVSADPFEPQASQECTFLSLDARSSSHVWILAAHRGDPCAYRHEIDIARKSTIRTAFGDESSISVCSILPSFATRVGEQSFVVVGDQLGHVHIYDWSPLTRADTVSAHRRFEAHEDGAVTALTATPSVLITGSAGGTTRIWDTLTLTLLRTFAAPPLPRSADAESVTQIAALPDMLVTAIGRQVVAWKAGPVSHHVGKVATRTGKKVKREAKGHRQYELSRDIKESSKLLEHEQAYVRRAYGREREQRNALEGLGLDEVEAVEYALMLSRDEEEGRRLTGVVDASQRNGDEGMFQADFEDVFDMPTPVVEQANLAWSTPRTLTTPPSSSAGRPSPPSTRSPSAAGVLSDHGPHQRSLPRSVPGTSNSRVQVSPRFRPEPMEAGFGEISPVKLSPVPPAGDDDGHFPAMSRTPSSTGRSTPSTPGTGSIRRSVSGSPDYARIARGGTRSTGASTPGTPGTSYSEAAGRASASGSPQSQRIASRAPMLTQTRSEPQGRLAASPPSGFRAQGVWANARPLTEQDEDADLKYAIELSLAEARSRGENV